MTRFIAWAALGILWSNAKLVLITSISSILLILAGVIFFSSVLGTVTFVFAQLYDLGLPQLAFQAVFMSLFAVRFLRLFHLQEPAVPRVLPYLKMVAGYVLRVLTIGFLVSVVWLALLFAGIAVLENLQLTAQQLSYLPLVVLFLSTTFVGWLWLRLALVLPAYVAGKPITWRAAWRASKSYKYQVILMSIVYYVVPWFTLVVLSLFLRYTTFVEPFLTTAIIWVCAVLKVTTLAAMYDRMLADQQSTMSEAFD